MFRKYVILSLAFSFALGTAGCTSKTAEGDGADVEASTDDGLEAADATDNNSDLTADGGEVAAPSNDELAPGESLPDTAVAGDVPPEVAPGDISEAPPADAPPEMSADAATPTGDPGATPDPSSPTPDSMASNGTPEPSSSEPAPVVPQASLQKIKDKPYTKGKTLVNAVYIARKGDSPEAISQKVFGTNSRTKELCKLNSYNCSRPLKVGDKFYYNSPQRPTDDTTLKVFYEDAGIQPETYVAKGGDNIRKVSKTLLGDSRSWMEVWATNTVESKGKLDEGTQLKYWPNSEVAVPAQAAAQPEQPGEMAQNDAGAPPPPPDMVVNEPPPSELGATPPPPPPSSDLPPAPDQSAGGMAAGSVEPPPPPPPPPPAAADPSATAEAGADPNQTMALGVGAVLLLAAAALFISIRKKRQRRSIDYTATQTQIDG